MFPLDLEVYLHPAARKTENYSKNNKVIINSILYK